jgi:hypothetical protein
MSQEAQPTRKAEEPPSTKLFAVALIVGAYATMPGFYLDGLHVKAGAEVVDHVVPGLVVLALVFVSILLGRRAGAVLLLAGVGILLAGFWMTDVHVALFRQALRGQAPAGATAYHCSTAVAVDILGVVWLWRYRHAGAA